MARRSLIVLTVLLLGLLGSRAVQGQPVPPTNTPTATRTPSNTPTATGTATAGPTVTLNPPSCGGELFESGMQESGGIWLMGTAGTAPYPGWGAFDCQHGAGPGCTSYPDGLHYTQVGFYPFNRHICDADNNTPPGYAHMVRPASPIGQSPPGWPWYLRAGGDDLNFTVEVQGIVGWLYTCMEDSAPLPCWRYDPRTSIYWSATVAIQHHTTFEMDHNRNWAVLVDEWDGSLTATGTPTRTPVPVEVPVHAWGYPICGPLEISDLLDHTYPSFNQPPNFGTPQQHSKIIYSNERWDQGVDGHDGVDIVRSGAAAGFPTAQRGLALSDSQARPVYAVANGRVIRAGLDKIGAGFNYGACSDILKESDNGSTVIEVKHNAAEGALYKALDGVLVARNAAVAKGQMIGMMGDSGNASAPHLHVTGVRYAPLGPYKSLGVFDPYGWDRDHTGMFPQPMDHHFDPWYDMNLVVSPRNWLPGGPPDPMGCPVPCFSAPVTVVDDQDAGFSCATCSGAVTTYGVNGSSTKMFPSGSYAENGRARWESGLDPGTYAVSVQLPGVTIPPLSSVPALAARYLIGSRVAQVNMASPVGWTFLGIYNYDVEPYVELSDAAFDLSSGWVDPDDCSHMLADAVAWQPVCFWPNIPSQRITLATSVPVSTVPVPTPCPFPPCRTPTPANPPQFPGGGG